MQTFKYDEIGVKVSKAELVAFLNDQQRGGFAYVHGYTRQDGEVAHYWFKNACIYKNIVARSLAMITDGTLAQKLAAHGIEVTRGCGLTLRDNTTPAKRQAGSTYMSAEPTAWTTKMTGRK